MCGRYRLARKKEILAEVFDVEDDDDWSPRYNIAPSQSVPVVRQDATRPVRSFSLIRWGLIPFWAKDAKAGYKMINARAETIAEKPAFREPLLSRRCLIPADGFLRVVEIQQGEVSLLLYPRGRLSLCVRRNLGPMEEPRTGTHRNVFDHYYFGKCTSVRHS
jgi:putative SOS response-associated peptidase YedK